jgi:hypothetical protein
MNFEKTLVTFLRSPINQINTISAICAGKVTSPDAACCGRASGMGTHISRDPVFGRCSDVSGKVWYALNTPIEQFRKQPEGMAFLPWSVPLTSV